MPTDALLRRMYEDFSALPPLENVARSVALDYLAPYNPVHAMIWHLRKNGTCVCLAQYGETESYVGRVYSATEWRALEPVGSLALNAKKEDAATWSADREFVVINLYSQNVLIGFLTVRFAKALNDTQKLKLDSGDCGRALSLYLALRFLEKLEIGNESPSGEYLLNSTSLSFDAHNNLSVASSTVVASGTNKKGVPQPVLSNP